MALSFNRANMCSGIETITVGQTSPRTVVFEKEMSEFFCETLKIGNSK